MVPLQKSATVLFDTKKHTTHISPNTMTTPLNNFIIFTAKRYHDVYNYILPRLTGLGELTVGLLAAGGLVREGLVTRGLVTGGLVTRGLVTEGLETGGLVTRGLETGGLVVVGLDMTGGELTGELGNISR